MLIVHDGGVPGGFVPGAFRGGRGACGWDVDPRMHTRVEHVRTGSPTDLRMGLKTLLPLSAWPVDM